jgi:hypothetical protein
VTKIFGTIGFFSAVMLTVFDYWTSAEGIKSFIPDGSEGFLAASVPFAVSGMVVSMNALSSIFFTRLMRDKDTQLSIKLVLFVFCMALIFDFGSSFVGFLLLFSGAHTALAAWTTAGAVRLVAAVVLAVAVTMGPLLASMFYELLKEHNSVIVKFFDMFQM